MANNPNKSGNTGRASLGPGFQEAAANIAGPALDLAQGASAFTAASNALKGAALDKLLGPTAIFAGGLIGVLRTMKSIVEQSGILERGLKNIASIQQIEGKFETLLKSADKAHARMKALYQFTANSPFDLKDVAEANRILETLTKGALSSAEGMKLVGDSAAATGQSMSETAERVGKLYAAIRSGRSLDKIMFQMQMTGAASDELAAKLETLQQSGAGANQMWDAAVEAMRRTEGGMKNEMQNLDALSKRLKFAGEMMNQAFATPFVNAQAAAIETSVKATENLTPLLGKIGQDIAPVLQFMSSAKNSVAEATIATKGFAEMMGVAWEAGKALFIGLAGTTLASFAARLTAGGGAVLQWGANLKAAADIAKASPASVAGLIRSTELATAASEAFGRAEYANAAVLKLKSFWTVVATKATNVHAASMMKAATATNGVSIATYLWATATQVAVGGLALLKVAAFAAGRAIAAFIVANPVMALGAAALAAGYAMKQWAESIAAVDTAYNKMIGTQGKLRAEMRAQVDAIRNLDQWKQALAANDAALKKNGDDQKKLGPRPSGGPVIYGIDGQRLDVGGQAQRDYDALNEEHNRTTRSLVAERARLMTRDMDTIGLSGSEQTKLGDKVAGEARLAEARRGAAMSNADEGGQLALMRAEIDRLQNEATVGKAIDDKRTSTERNPGPTELTRLQDKIDAIEGGGPAGKGELNGLYAERARLGSLADTHVDKAVTAEGLRAELKARTEALGLKTLELELDEQIAQVRAVGWETSAMEAGKELILLKEQLRIAKEKGKAGELDARIAQQRIASIEADRAKARAETAIDRAKNNATINGNPKAAQALQDNADLAKLRAEYAGKGLTTAQADSDFAASIKAQAMSAQPRIVSDSMQSIGGGGGSYGGGGDPLLAAQARLQEIGKTQTKYLKILADAATGQPSTLRE